MSRTRAWTRLILCVAAAVIVPAFVRGSQIEHWELGFTTTDADLSPDDKLLAVTLESPTAPQKAGERIAESLEVWDYQRKVKLGSTQLSTYLRIRPTPNAVRFTADGRLLVASEPTKVHVFDAASLNPIRVIELPLVQRFRITALETSPTGHVAIVAADNGLNSGVLFACDLDAGRILLQWTSPHAVSSIAWKQDGSQFAVATPFLCTRFRDTIHIFSTNPWLHLQTLTARNPTSVAFSEDRLYLVESSFCRGSVFDRHLGLEVFSLRGRRRQLTTYLPHSDIHSSVSFASGRLLANTGEVRTEHNWLDATTWGIETNARFTVWEGDAGSIIFTSQPLEIPPHHRDISMRLSRTGNMVLFNPQNPQVFRVVP